MKKLSILIALICCLTVGGTYAAWLGVTSNDIANSSQKGLVALENAELEGSAGTFTTESNFSLSIDQGDAEHHAVLVFVTNDGTDNPYVKFTFNPSKCADAETKNKAIPAEMYFTTTTTMKYQMDAEGNYKADGKNVKDVFTFNNYSDGVFNENVTWVKNSDGTFSVTYDKAALESMIRLTEPFQLDTKAEYDAFREILTGHVVIHITDGTITKDSKVNMY